MTRETLATLFHPFETGDLDVPGKNRSGLFLGATDGFRLPAGFDAKLDLVQGFRPDFLTLERRGHSVLPAAEKGEYDLVLVLASRHRGENEACLAEAVRRVRQGGLVVMAGGKTDGAASLRKRLEKTVPLRGHLSKNHGIVFWFEKGAQAETFAASVVEEQDASPLVEGRFRAAPGMFSHDRVDAGSKLLAENLPENLSGLTADFCAGWGYLSVALGERARISGIDLYEADHASLEAARRNMAALAPGLPAGFHWRDLVSEKVERKYDLIVMNPPFHQGRAADPGLGLAMIKAASGALKPGGQLFMVANRGLPYEAALQSMFAQSTEIAADKTFKIFRARR